MKGRYNGCIISVTGTILPGASRLARLQVELSKKVGKDLNGLITTIYMDTMPVSPAATMASHLKLSIAGKDAIIPGT